jgi:hypothetical protein
VHSPSWRWYFPLTRPDPTRQPRALLEEEVQIRLGLRKNGFDQDRESILSCCDADTHGRIRRCFDLRSGDTTATREQHNGTARWQHTRGETCKLRGEAMTTLVNSCALACLSSAQSGISTPSCRQQQIIVLSFFQTRHPIQSLQHRHFRADPPSKKHPSTAGSRLRPSKPTIKTRLAADLLGSRTSNVEPLTFCYTTATIHTLINTHLSPLPCLHDDDDILPSHHLSSQHLFRFSDGTEAHQRGNVKQRTCFSGSGPQMHHGFEAAGSAGPTLLQRLSQPQAGSSSELEIGVVIPLGNHRRRDFDRRFEAEELPWRWKLDIDELALT